MQEKVKAAGKCPFGHGQQANEAVPVQDPVPKVQSSPPVQPTFIQSPEAAKTGANAPPQMIFTGPVFIGYPIEQAMALMQQWKSTQ
jgi:hypothetical protein